MATLKRVPKEDWELIYKYIMNPDGTLLVHEEVFDQLQQEVGWKNQGEIDYNFCCSADYEIDIIDDADCASIDTIREHYQKASSDE